MPHEATRVRDIEPFFKRAKIYVEGESGLWDWNDDIEFIGLCWVEFKDRVSGQLFTRIIPYALSPETYTLTRQH